MSEKLELALIEKERKIVKKKVDFLRIFCIVFAVILGFCYWHFTQRQEFQALFLIGFGFFAFYKFAKDKISQKIRLKFKVKILSKIIKSINQSFTYIPQMHISRTEFEQAGIFKFVPNSKFRGDDFISGEINGVKFKMSDADLSEIRGSGRYAKRMQIFKGVVFIADFYKNFSPIFRLLLVSSKEAELSGKQIKLDNSEFNANFKTYTNDKITAFYILTPSLMSRILKLKKQRKCDIDIAFWQNKIYIFINDQKDNFELDINTELSSLVRVFESYKNELSSFFDIINDLNLELKIFKK